MLPPYYEGRELPMDSLSPAEFEEFVFACLLLLQDVLKLRITGKPSRTGDGGFDIQGMSTETNRLVCIQCKRQQAPLGTDQAAIELAKVAARCALDESDVGQHRFICTGGTRTKLLGDLRQLPRTRLATEACRRLATSAELAALKADLEAAGLDPQEVVKSYVLGLDLIAAWDRNEFDAALSARWNEVLGVVQRYFRVAVQVIEHPRASFDRAGYIAEYSSTSVPTQPRLTHSQLPSTLTWTPAPQLAPRTAATKAEAPRTLDDLADLRRGDLVVLLGDGGVGKSTTLSLIRARALVARPIDLLPVQLSLAAYLPGGLDDAIHRELGVVHGTWRSLPDLVLLLCDGLNECAPDNAIAFLNELGPLLKRGQIACVLSTRESTRHPKLTLPREPLSCLKVQGLTPIGVRRLALHHLQDRTADTFVTTYRALIAKSPSPLLWTPFAVMAAAQLWQETGTLPNTLGEMLHMLLRARAARDADLPGVHLAVDVTLQLAGALAFQFLLKEHRLESPAVVAGRMIRAAREQCVDALGVTDLREEEVVNLLARHELLRVSRDGSLAFSHHIVAGALAAPALSRAWRGELASLTDSLTDDAWVFAARLLPAEELGDFLETVIGVDVTLGARAARELPANGLELAEQLLFRSVAQERSEALRARGLFALALVGSPAAIGRLRQLAAEADQETAHVTQKALAAAGDLQSLRNLLPTVDLLRSDVVKVSGGEVAIWEAAPPAIRLDLARERLSHCIPGEPVGESLSLLAYERDPGDAELAERHFRAARTLSQWGRALYAVNEISSRRARELLEEELASNSNPSVKASAMQSAMSAGLDIDIRAAFEVASAELAASHTDSDAFAVGQLISHVIKDSPLPAECVAVVERELPQSVGDRRTRLWRLACCCESAPIAEYAIQRIESWADDVGYACNCLAAQLATIRDQRARVLKALEHGLADEVTWYSWDCARALDLVGDLGGSARSAEILAAMIERLARVERASSTGNMSGLTQLDAALLESTDPAHARISLSQALAPLVPAAAKARELLADSVLLSLLRFDTTSHGIEKEMQEAVALLSDALIDDMLASIDDPWVMRSALQVACCRGITDIRIRLLEREFTRSYSHLAALHLVVKAIEASWCPAVCAMVLRAVAEIPKWTAYEAQFAWDFVRAVSQRVGPFDVPAIEESLDKARTDFARRILKLWRDQASGDRLGLGRLRPELDGNDVSDADDEEPQAGVADREASKESGE